MAPDAFAIAQVAAFISGHLQVDVGRFGIRRSVWQCAFTSAMIQNHSVRDWCNPWKYPDIDRVMARKPSVANRDVEQEFSALFRQHYRPVLAFARRRVGADACQEIAAETFLVAWRRFESVPEHALPWLYQVATFTIANYRRRAAKERRSDGESVLGRAIVTLDPADEAIDSEHLRSAFACLSDRDREILRLAAWEGLNTTDGAAVLGCSVTAYKVRLHRARSRLARKVSSPLPAPEQKGVNDATALCHESPAHVRPSEEPA